MCVCVWVWVMVGAPSAGSKQALCAFVHLLIATKALPLCLC